MRKKAEKRVKDIANHYGYYSHKYGDVRYCIHCKKPLPKTERAPDFYISQIGDWVEAKNNDSSGRWNCSELFEDGERANQRQFLIDNDGWLFLELSDGHGPSNTSAWLISFWNYLHAVEPMIIEDGLKSIRRENRLAKDGSVIRYGAETYLAGYELEWEQHTGWIIPKGHPYWLHLREELKEALEIVESKLEE